MERGNAGGLEPTREHDLTQRSERLEVVKLAVSAHAEAGHPDRADLLRPFLHYGNFQDEGATNEQLAEAGVGLTLEGAISSIASAGELWAERGYEGRAHLCCQLADFYERRAAGEVDAVYVDLNDGDAEAMRHFQELHDHMAHCRRRWPTLGPRL